MNQPYEWLIIGGGVHGMTVFHALLERGVKQKNIAIIDRHATPLANWQRQTARIEMPYLRSTRVHHTSTNPTSLRRFADEQEYTSQAFKDTYGRPSLELFNDHAIQLAKQNGADESWFQADVSGLSKSGEYWQIKTSNRIFRAKRVVLALGQSERLHLPDWADATQHVFEEREETPPVLVIGGGISAIHYTIRCAKKFPGQVTLITKRSLEQSAFDADRKFMGPKGLTPFKSLSLRERRQLIAAERKPGTAPQELIQRIRHLIRSGHVIHQIGEVKQQTTGGVMLTDGSDLKGTTIVCATGIRPLTIQGSWLESVQRQFDLPLSPCGTPVLNEETFEWGEGLYATGSLADLTVGPFARSIYGGQVAARAIVTAVV